MEDIAAEYVVLIIPLGLLLPAALEYTAVLVWILRIPLASLELIALPVSVAVTFALPAIAVAE